MHPGGAPATHRLEAALLRPVGAILPAQAVVADLAGEAALLRIEGDWAGTGTRSAAFCASVPLATLAVGPAPREVATACDLATRDSAEADRWCAGFSRAPRAAHAAALLVREPPPTIAAGLVAESATYSLLQAGPEFRRWLATRRASGPEDADAPRVRVARAGGVAEVVLDRPARHNALDIRMRDELCDVLTGLLTEPETAVIVRGEGPSFCSGGDLADFGTAPGPVEAHALRLGRSPARLFAALGPRLTVGVHGAALGAGIELAAFAATVVAADDARIGLPELGLGLIPGAGGTVSIPRRAGRQRLLELLYTGEAIGAATACEWGLVDEVVPARQLAERLRRAASPVSARP